MMWKVDKPSETVEDTFAACISKVASVDLLDRLEGVADAIAEAAEGYDTAAEAAELHTIAATDGINGAVTTKEMVKVYDQRMVPEKSPGRDIYNSIFALAKHGRCPFCGHRAVMTLDHVLAKTRYPIFAVTPNNLVPCCTDCNKAKSNAICALPEDQYLHPYYDAIEEDLWLRGEVIETVPAVVQFHVEPPEDWTDLTAARVRTHFKQLGLARLYRSQAADELNNIQYQVAQLHAKSGMGAVREFLLEAHESRSASRTNSWQTAFYEALSASDWYCDGGFA
ncbi:hypothetical protein DBR17_14540 [Sphingomonas sp. HMWF008]|nr:hypothetical protein DBR17_14540 [Sphingomonas sp. HMWF008]